MRYRRRALSVIEALQVCSLLWLTCSFEFQLKMKRSRPGGQVGGGQPFKGLQDGQQKCDGSAEEGTAYEYSKLVRGPQGFPQL